MRKQRLRMVKPHAPNHPEIPSRNRRRPGAFCFLLHGSGHLQPVHLSQANSGGAEVGGPLGEGNQGLRDPLTARPVQPLLTDATKLSD